MGRSMEHLIERSQLRSSEFTRFDAIGPRMVSCVPASVISFVEPNNSRRPDTASWSVSRHRSREISLTGKTLPE
jgi:hypothetical protein